MTDRLLLRYHLIITDWAANVSTEWRRHRLLMRSALAVLWAVSAIGKLLRLLHAGSTAISSSVSRYVKLITMGLLRFQGRANEEYAIEVAAWNLGDSLTNETWSG